MNTVNIRHIIIYHDVLLFARIRDVHDRALYGKMIEFNTIIRDNNTTDRRLCFSNNPVCVIK